DEAAGGGGAPAAGAPPRAPRGAGAARPPRAPGPPRPAGVGAEGRLGAELGRPPRPRAPPRADEADLADAGPDRLDGRQEGGADLAPPPPVVPDAQEVEPLRRGGAGGDPRGRGVAVERQADHARLGGRERRLPDPGPPPPGTRP